MKKIWVLFFGLFISLPLVGGGLAQDSANNSQSTQVIQKLESQIHQLLQLQTQPPAAVDPEMEMPVAIPTLTGTWKGTISSINSDGVCARQGVLLTVTKQCGNLFKGTIKIGTNPAINVLGRHYSSTTNVSYVSLSGTYTSSNPYSYISFSLSGQYLTSPSPRIKTTYFYFYTSGSSGTTSYQYDYDLILIKQP